MTISYEDIFGVFLTKISDPRAVTLSESNWIELEKGWLKSALSNPRIRNLFLTYVNDEDMEELNISLKNSVDEASDIEFLCELLSLGMTIAWMAPEINSILNTSVMIGAKEEKKVRDNYKSNIAVLKDMKTELKKMIRDYGYDNNDYIKDY